MAVDDIAISLAPPGMKAYMDDRDEAMRNKCPGGMFDCDGDRREYARNQWASFQKRMEARESGANAGSENPRESSVADAQGARLKTASASAQALQ